MGSWNHTCMVSQMHILEGDEVVELWLVEQNSYNKYSHYVYSTHLWRPYPVLMYGKYTDYGESDAGLQDCPRVELLLDLIKQDIVEREQGENPYHDHAVVKEGLDFKRLHTIDHGGRGQVKGYKGPLALKHALVKKSLFDKILNEYYIEEARWKNKEKWTGYHTVKIYFADVVKNLVTDVRWVQNYLEQDINITPDMTEVEIEEAKRYARIMRGVGRSISETFWGNEDAPLFTKYMGGDGENRTTTRNINYFGEESVGCSDEELANHIEEHLKFQWLAMFMSASRKPWMPQVGQGSQSAEILPYKLLADWYKADIKDQKKRYEED